MNSPIKHFLFLLCIAFGLASCEKDYSVEGIFNTGGTQGGTAVFTLDGAPGLCNGSQVQGTYKVGTAVTATENVVLTVNVTALGTYTLSTNAVNGITFAGAGTFTTLGLQFIQLNAAGTPTATGVYNYLAGVTFCSFPVTVTAGGGSSGTSAYTFNGAPNACTTPVISGTYTAGTPLTASNTVVLTANVTTVGTYTITTATANGMTFNATGTFAATGTQTVTFTGSGTPTAAGNTNFLPGTATTGCTFTIPVAAGAGGGTSAFTFTGAPGACTAAVIAGTYTQGTALNASNTVTLQVNVTTVGTYTISATASGMTFAKTGTFAATGNQTVVLNGTGTPTASGAISLTPTGASAAGCSFTITVAGGGGGPTIFLKATIGGVAYEFNTNLVGDRSTGPDELYMEGEQSLPGTGPRAAYLDFIGALSAVTTGAYSNLSATNVSKFVDFGYTPDGVAIFRTNQTNNSFQANLTTLTATSATGTFSGSIYEDGTGTVPIVVTNGSFSITF